MAVRKTTIEIDEDLIEEVRSVFGTEGINDTIDAALQDVRRREAIKRFTRFLDEVGDDILSSDTAAQRWRGP
jgi:Arc/MetJ family transcription regulator